MANQSNMRWRLDREIEKDTEGRISASRLRKDRLGAQLFPFHRIGRSVYYDLDEINAVIENSRFGGKLAPVKQRVKAAD